MKMTVTSQIAAFRRMTVGELRQTWQRLYNGEETRSRNRDYLIRRLAWRIQELQHGGLSDRAKSRIEELAEEHFTRARTPKMSIPVTDAKTAPAKRRDPRLPPPGSVISKQYKGRDLRVLVHDDGYEIDAAMFGSLTAIAKQLTGSRNISGRLFFGLVKRQR